MDIKSLMVGDWVKIKTYGVSDKFERTEAYIYVKVAEIGSGLITVEYNNDIKEPYRICENTEIEPVPLTPEILEKNGFEKTWQDNFVYDNEDIGLIITFHPKETNYTNGTYNYIDIEKGCVTIMEMPIEFVHQLQHVLRLCEVSIEIIEL